jgi:4-amino-4-deoxy-L-arabinose transferase-like glycosyltransferase
MNSQQLDVPFPWRVGAAIAILFALFFGLGSRGLNEPDEARYAEVSREMMVSGDYLTPQLMGVPHLSKPPVTYWLAAVSMRIFGVNEWAVRLPAALAAAGALLAVYLLTASVCGQLAGLGAALVLVTSPLFFMVGRLITTDMIMTAMVTGSVACLWRWYIAPTRSIARLAGFYVFMGLGLLTKGPVAVALPVFALAGLLWRNPRLSWRDLHPVKGLLLMLAVAAPWFVAVTWQKPDLWSYFIGRELVGRMASSVHGRTHAWWFFVPVLAAGMVPWCVWIVVAAARLRLSQDNRADLARMCAAWAGLGLLLFTVSRSKLATYIVPLLPPLAVLTAMMLTRLQETSRLSATTTVTLAGGCGSAILSAAGAIGLATVGHLRFGLPVVPAVVLALAGVLGAAIAAGFFILNGSWPGALALAASCLVTLVYIVYWMPRLEQNLQHNSPVRSLAALVRSEDPAGIAPVLAYRALPLGFPFYLNRPVYFFDPPQKSQRGHVPNVMEYHAQRGLSPYALPGKDAFAQLWQSAGLAFCVAGEGRIAELESDLGGADVIGKTAKWVLLRNRATQKEDRSP